MRSRFTAYALREVDYLVSTHDPEHLPDRKQIQDWARRARFTGLDIEDAVGGGAGDSTGVVEFVADYEEAGEKRQHHERSNFKKIDGRWFYADAAPPTKRRR